MSPETFEAYRFRFTAGTDVKPFSASDAAELRPLVLARLSSGERVEDERIEALAWLTYKHSANGGRAFGPSLDEVLADLTANASAAVTETAALEALVEPSESAPADPATEQKEA